MKRFDVFTLKRNKSILALNIQADLFDDLSTTIILPLYPTPKYKNEFVKRLRPFVMINDQEYILGTTNMASISKSNLDKYVTNLENKYRDTIVDSLDFLFQGF